MTDNKTSKATSKITKAEPAKEVQRTYDNKKA
jgi:hypothetical protein